MRSWAAEGAFPGPVLWISVDDHALSADAFRAGLVERLSEQGIVPPPGAGFAEIGAYVGGLDPPVVLVLDDVGPGPVPADCVLQLLGNSGAGLRVLVTSRQERPLPVHRYLVAGQLVEIHAADLYLTGAEMAAVLRRHGLTLSAAGLRGLLESTAGWPAGVRLAALAMTEDGHEPEEVAASFSGGHRSVVGYLTEEVLDAQAAGTRRLLLLLAGVADRFNADLAVELAGEEGGAEFAELVRQNAFVERLDDGWFRYQPMFGAAFRMTQEHESAAEVRGLHRKAAAWFAHCGRLGDAVGQAVLAEDWNYASRLVVDRYAIGDVLGLMPGSSLTALFRDMPDFAGSEPEPAVVAAAVAVVDGDEDTYRKAIDQAENMIDQLRGEDGDAARTCVAAVRLAHGSAHLEGVHNPLSGVPHRVRDERPDLIAMFVSAPAVAALTSGRLGDAAVQFEAAAADAARAGGGRQIRSCLGFRALTEALRGNIAQAAAATAHLPEEPAAGRVAVAHLACAWVSVARHELTTADDELAKAGAALAERPDRLLEAIHGLIRARAEIGHDQPVGAVETVSRVLARAEPPPWLERRLRLVLAEAYILSDRPDDGRLAAEQAGGSETAASAVALARAELHRDDVAAAADLLRPALVDSVQVPADVRVDAWLLDADMSYRAADASRGRRSLAKALRLAQREQIRSPFALARAWLEPVLQRDPELSQHYARFLEPLRMALPCALGVDLPMPNGVEPLSSRELDVLRLLALMMTTEEIAGELSVSVNTVKTHLKSIFCKLAVTRRGEAVQRARAHALLD
ncbi:LuxR C-terminal-related transcriptional regulator [Nonomuraea sp. NPDC050536]|uniref:helix-turn-helix transcriptional regulator n=1 Tax=Nonomuraea sp. NPDC050536 TaxID=3364366 RepID=UPI0037C85266